jgi:1,2-diacylglycerol 3-beta-galactosyltransferase
MLPIAQRLGNSDSPLQLIMICGRNSTLLERLRQLKTKNKIVVEGFTKEIPRYMSISDFFIGKPGPGSISEALKLNLPVIVERNAWTLPQERYNAQWIAEQGVGIVLENFRQIDGAVRDLLTTRKLADMKALIATIDNRALFEIPPILAGILEKRSHAV